MRFDYVAWARSGARETIGQREWKWAMRLLIATMFLNSVTFKGVLGFDLRLSYPIWIILLGWVMFRTRTIPVWNLFALMLFLLALFPFWPGFFSMERVLLCIRQLAGISVLAAVYYMWLGYRTKRLQRVFVLYINFAVILSILSITQEIGSVLHLNPLYDYSWFLPNWRLYPYGELVRAHSIMAEPAHFALIMMPACFVATVNMLNPQCGVRMNIWKGIVLLAGMWFAFSGVALVGLYLSFGLALFASKANWKRFAVVAIVFILMGGLYLLPEPVHKRVKDSLQMLSGRKEITQVNQSTGTLAFHASVAWRAFSNSPIIGNGLGSYPLLYDECREYARTTGLPLPRRKQNRKDGNSLFLRMAAETGLFGLVILAIFLFRYHVPFEPGTYSLLNTSALIYMLLRLLRFGHYFNLGMFFFVWVYYFSYQLDRKSRNAGHLLDVAGRLYGED